MPAVQESFLGVEAQGLPDAAQGDVKGAQIKGGIKEAVQAGIQEGQFFQEGGLAGGVLPALLQVKLAGEMPGVAAEGGGAEAELPGQGAVGYPLDEAAVDLRAGRVRANRTAHRLEACATRVLHHNCAPRQKFPQHAGWISGYQGRGGGARRGGENDGVKGEKEKGKK
jgi:hypothetical protein